MEREKIISMIKTLELVISSCQQFHHYESLLDPKLLDNLIEIKETLLKLFNKDLVLLDSEKIKQDVINSKVELNNIVFSTGDNIKRYAYSINWVKNQVVNYNLSDNKEELDMYVDDEVANNFINLLLQKYNVSKEE